MLSRYCGAADEPLCAEGIAELACLTEFFPAEIVFASPMKRAVSTAELCFPNTQKIIVNDFREMNFGAFEGRTAAEMENDEEYTKWVNSFCEDVCPNGESVGTFSKRTCAAFENIVCRSNAENAAVVAHGGTIMAIFSQFAEEKREYFDWHVKNGCGYAAKLIMRGNKHVLTDITEISCMAVKGEKTL